MEVMNIHVIDAINWWIKQRENINCSYYVVMTTVWSRDEIIYISNVNNFQEFVKVEWVEFAEPKWTLYSKAFGLQQLILY